MLHREGEAMTTSNQGSAEQANLTGTVSVQRVCTSTPEQVWEVLADGWAFPSWVVGASRMRAVEPDWPAVGSKLHHSIGTWPAVLDDETQVREVDPGRRLVLRARTRPVGEQTVEITVAPHADGGSLITMREDAAKGPARLVPRPARQAGLAARNRETLRRLCLLAERRPAP